MSIIALTGYAGSGKDTVAKMIQYYYAHNHKNFNKKSYTLENHLKNPADLDVYSGFQIKKFASKLKQICAIILNCKEDDFENIEFKDSCHEILQGKTVRYLLQYIGTEVGRNLNKDIWINSLFSEYKPKNLELNKTYSESDLPNWIISDLRFINEAEAIKSRSGIIIKIERHQNKDEHLSETELNSIVADYILKNYGTIEELYNNLKTILNEHKFN